jgi:GNAT superfamily N-acetyltransferase
MKDVRAEQAARRGTDRPADAGDGPSAGQVVVPETLRAHLADRVGWPPATPVRVVGSPARSRPGWDGRTTPIAGVVTDTGDAVVAVPPDGVERVPADVALEDLLPELPALLGLKGRIGTAAFRWTTRPSSGPDEGVWLPVDDPRVPPWLHPFGSDVLVALTDGAYVAGVGIKRHDRYVHELAVVTHERARGRGLARRLVAQAARRVLENGALPTYLYAPANVASARVATAAGFPDVGWHALTFFADPPG